MKVIHILNELKFSGAEIMYADAAPIFQELGCELTIVNTAPNLGEFAPEFEKQNCKVLHLPYPKNYWQRWKYYNKIIKILHSEQYDVVHIHSSALKWGGAYCAWRAGCNSVYTFHNVFISHWYSYFYHFWLRWSAKHLFRCKFQTISDSVYANEKTYYHNETYQVNNWYGSNRFSPAKEGEKIAIRTELGIPAETKVIISVGGCSPIKRHEDIINAMVKLKQWNTNILYLHLGNGGTHCQEIELAKSLGVDKYIRFLGNKKDVRKYLIASDIYVMTSRFEGISLTTIEAMACKIPTILYNVPGLCDFNKEKECSIMIPEDSDELAKSIIHLINDNKKQLSLIETAKEFVEEKFSMKKNALKIYNLYK